jgi:hypothetical protein
LFRLPAESVDLETDGAAGGGGGDQDEDREHWGSQWEFIFSCVGMSVGIGRVSQIQKEHQKNQIV